METVYKTPLIRTIESEKTTIGFLTILCIAASIIIYAFTSLPPEASITKTITAEVTAKDNYLRLSMFIPFGDNILGIPVLESVYQITTSNGEKIQVNRDQFEKINRGDEVTINYWVRGWLDGKSLDIGLQ